MRWRGLLLCSLALSLSSVIYAQTRRVHNHVSSVCSTWGTEHFKTFDGDVYQFPSMCEYNLVSDCHDTYHEFSVHLKRKEAGGRLSVRYVLVTIHDLVIRMTKSAITVNNVAIHMPYYDAGVQLERNAVYTKLQAKAGIVVMWNGDDSVMVEVDSEYANRTCGLCGDFNGVAVDNEFIHNGRKISTIEFGNTHKVHLPNDDCEDPYEQEEEAEADRCKEFQSTCEELLYGKSWSSCTAVLNPEPYIKACIQDMCVCANNTDDFCVCSTLSEYSRQCSHAGGQPPNWRTPQFCAKQCPFNMVYEESGPPCMDTCTQPDTSSLCEDHRMDGCFCPPGTVFDDISVTGCIPQSECQCKHQKVYNTGEIYKQDGKECTCYEGRWSCKNLPKPATCAVEEGSHVTTFDGKAYNFHGDCYYILAKVESRDGTSPKFTVLAQLAPCVSHQYDTCMKTLKVLLNNDRNNMLIFTADGKVRHNMQIISFPYHTGDINIFQASSFHIVLQTSYGLQIQIQHVPVMQVYVTLDEGYKTKTRGLCGDYNMVLRDDMKTPQGMVEGTASSFANSWKSKPTCTDRMERLDEPCSLSVENAMYAKHWCSLLRSPESAFAQCHTMVDPESYYKRCTYASCNCDKSEDCLCAVFSSYARACASKGVFLTNWRENVCNKYTRSCPESQTYSYKLQRCQLTCRSLAVEQQTCTSDFLPVDGCSCPDGLYLDDKGICVPMAKCACFHNGVHIMAGKSINIKNEHCICTNAKLHCRSWQSRALICPPTMEFFNCSNAVAGQQGVQCARSCSNLDSIDCYSTDCESGCQCPTGLIDDGKGSCVNEHDCPCQHDGLLYASGRQIPNQCNTCTCKRGRWDCTEKKCPGTCIIYGSGHYSTFDQQKYGFHGTCSYVAVQNKCGNKTIQDDFRIITENIPCGTTGTTCSKSVRIKLGRTEVKLFKGKYEEIDLGDGTLIKYRIRHVGLYLVVETSIGVAVLWDRKTTVRVILEPQHSGEVCGLCGDFDGDGQNDFTTQGQLEVSSLLEFANSWKVSSSCPDAEANVDPCGAMPNRQHWAEVQCSIIKGDTFKECHNKVDHVPYYDNCVKDSCACDTGGDCECFCTAVAAYAQACNEAGECVAWRTPEICPIFCDYYNGPDECNWHYNSCHTPCYKTCLNPQGICTNPIPNLEGCYPVCPEDKPIFDEKNRICVEECGCIYNGTVYEENEVIYNVTDNLGTCYYAICINATVIFINESCPTSPPVSTTQSTSSGVSSTLKPWTSTSTPTTTTAYTTTPTTPSTTTTQGEYTTPCITVCEWSEWYDVDDAKDGSDWETYENITNNGKQVCEKPRDIKCRSTDSPDWDFDDFVDATGQVVTCDLNYGLICRKEDQDKRPKKCFNYKIQVECCVECEQSTTEPTTHLTTTVVPSTTPPETTTPHPIITVITTTTTTSTTKPTPPPSTTVVSSTTPNETTVITTSSTTKPTPSPHPTTTVVSSTTPHETTVITTSSTTKPTTPPTTTVVSSTTPHETTLITTSSTTKPTPSPHPTTTVVSSTTPHETTVITTSSTTTATPHPTTTVVSSTTPPETTVSTTSSTTTATPHPTTTVVPSTTPHETTLITTSSTTTATPHPTTTVVPSTTPTKTTVTTTTTSTTKPATLPTTTYTTPCITVCEWSEWYDVDDAKDGSDWETYENITNNGNQVCEKPRDIKCRSTDSPDWDFDDFVDATGQVVTCDLNYGLICRKEDQDKRPKKCFNYKIQVECCVECEQSTTEPTTHLTTTVGPSTTPPETTTPHPIITVITTTTTTSTTKPTPPPSTTVVSSTTPNETTVITTSSTTKPTPSPHPTTTVVSSTTPHETTVITTSSTTKPTTPPTTTVVSSTTPHETTLITTSSTTKPTPPPTTTVVSSTTPHETTVITTSSTTKPTTPPTTTVVSSTTPHETTLITTSSTTKPTPPPTTTVVSSTTPHETTVITTSSTTKPTPPPHPTTTVVSSTTPHETTVITTSSTTKPTPPPTTTVVSSTTPHETTVITTSSTTKPTTPPTTTVVSSTTPHETTLITTSSTTKPTPPPTTTVVSSTTPHETTVITTSSTTKPTPPPHPTTTVVSSTTPHETTVITTSSTTKPTPPPTTTVVSSTTPHETTLITTSSTTKPTPPPTTTVVSSTTPPETTVITTSSTTTATPHPTTTVVPSTTPLKTTVSTTTTSTTKPTTTVVSSTTPHETTVINTSSTTKPTTPPTTTVLPSTTPLKTTVITTTKPTPPPTTTVPLTTPPKTTVTTTTTTTSTTKPTPHPTTTVYSSTPGTTQCFCIVDDQQYEPGDIIFNMTDIGSGICLTMTCSDICELQNKTDLCPTTTPRQPTPSPTISVPVCPEWDKVQNETFFLCNCTMAKCIENNTIEIVPYECPPLENITCANGKDPVLVYDEYYCCQYYACDCVCEGWGDPHYITFDGLFYSYQGNCTYTLMEEIRPKHNFRIYIDNVFCDPTEDVSCPRSIIVSFGTQVITLKNHNLIGTPKLEALIDGVSLKLPYSHNGVKIINSGIIMVLEIPHLQVVVTFGVTGFGVNLPFQYFGNNTQGHCGTCNNNQADDCMLPGGQLVQSCAVMADYWPVNHNDQPDCHPPSVLPTNSPVPPPTQIPCQPDSLCELIKSSVFEECLPFVSPDKFYEGCIFDSCHVSNPAVQCTSLQAYAAACSQAGVCLHWRNHTTLCRSDCPSDKVYRPCGPAEPPTCEDSPNDSTMEFKTEGCFCPDGMKLFNKESGICVNKCGCLDADGVPREFNEVFEHNCQTCICEESTKAVNCKSKVCPSPPVESCLKPGFVLINQTDPSDPCCTAYVCKCDSSTCPAVDMNCPIGYKPVITVPEGNCCPEHTCEPKRVCVHKNMEYEAGSAVPAGECQDCTCTAVVDPKSGLYKVECEFRQCDTKCERGYEYVDTKSDKCCGRCVQTHCVLNVSETEQLLKPGESWSPPEHKCDHYTCVKSNDNERFTIITSNILCPPFQQSNCQPDTIQTAANGCCKVCVEKDKACKMGSMRSRIIVKGCQSFEEVDMPFCEGSCNTFTKYSELAAVMEHSCSCCQESRSSNRTVDLHCLNGEVVPYTYVHVQECSCSATDCTRAVERHARKRRSFTLV